MKASVVSVIAVLPLLAAFAAGAQQLNQPSKTQPAQPLNSATQSSSNTLVQPATNQNRAVSSDPAQRSQAPKISAKGPAADADRPVQPANSTPQAPAKPVRVTDNRGQLVGGALQVGPNRVMDPKTGRTYTTVPDGEGQRIVEPRTKK